MNPAEQPAIQVIHAHHISLLAQFVAHASFGISGLPGSAGCAAWTY